MTPAPHLSDLISTVLSDASSEDLLDQLVTASNVVADLQEVSDALLGHFVDRCREEGLTWVEISSALGVTKQAVHKRFAENAASPRAARPRRGEDAMDLDRDFEASCRVAIGEVQRLGFMPGGWIAMIDQMGARGAAHHLLATGNVLPLFHFLVGAKRTDLSVEWMALQPKWQPLFDDGDRAAARDRLERAGIDVSQPS